MQNKRLPMIAMTVAGLGVLVAGLAFTPQETYGVETDIQREEAEDENRPRNADRPVTAPAPSTVGSLSSEPLPPQAPLDAPGSAVDQALVVSPPSAGDAGLAAQLSQTDNRNQVTFLLGLGLVTFGIGSLVASRCRAR